MGCALSKDNVSQANGTKSAGDQQQAAVQPQNYVGPQTAPADAILGKPYENINNWYKLKKELGQGQFAVTRLCTEKKHPKATYACKSISKAKLENSDKEDIKREIQIMKHLSGQQNIIEFKGAYEDKSYVHLVMELCTGGELFERIRNKGQHSEKEAARICRDIMNVVNACHLMGVVHRDIKPENFLYASKDEGAMLKAIDFGLSAYIEDRDCDEVGTRYYVAPEVLKGKYGKEIDIWSTGVILYILLSGVPPFYAETDEGTFDAIRKGDIDFASQPWPSISEPAKDLVRKMLTKDPKKRISVEQVLEDPWLKEGGEASDKPIDSAVLCKLNQYRHMNKFKKMTLKFIAKNLSDEDIKGVKAIFSNLDTDKSGTITSEELKNGLARLGTNLSENEVKHLLEAADADGNGSIDYNEFISAMHRYGTGQEELRQAFQHFDEDNDGFITREELEKAMKDQCKDDDANIEEIIKESDTNKDGKIDFEEFCKMMKSGSQKK